MVALFRDLIGIFERCPQCGNNVRVSQKGTGHCYHCGCTFGKAYQEVYPKSKLNHSKQK